MTGTPVEIPSEVSSIPYKKPFKIDVSVDTMMERLAQVHTPLSSQSRGRMVAIHRPSGAAYVGDERGETTDLVGYKPAEEGTATSIIHFFRDSRSHSGWSHVQHSVSLPSPGAEVRALYGFHQNGVTYLLVQCLHEANEVTKGDKVQVLYATFKDGRPTWKKWRARGTAANALERVAQLSVLRRRDGSHVVYGVSKGWGPERPQFFMLLPKIPQDDSHVEASDIGFTAVRDSIQNVPGSGNDLQNQTYQIAELPADAGTTVVDGFELLRLFDGGVEFHSVHVTGQGNQRAFRFEANSFDRLNIPRADLRNARLRIVPLGRTEALLVHQPDGHLGMIKGHRSNRADFERLTGTEEHGPDRIRQLSTGTLSRPEVQSSELILFASDGEDRLWARRMIAGEPSSNWEPLGDKVEAIACPRVASNHGELFFVGKLAAGMQDGFVRHKTMNGQNRTWTTETLAVATMDTNVEPISAHVFDIHVTDADGIGLLNHSVTITCDAPANLYIGGICHRTGPHLPLELRTDPTTARIRVVIRAAGMSAPKMHVRVAEGRPTYPAISPNARVSRRLAGNVKGYKKQIVDVINENVPSDHRKNVHQAIEHYGDAACKSARGITANDSLRARYKLSARGSGHFSNNTKDPANIALFQEMDSIPDWPHGFANLANFLGNALHTVETVFVSVFDAGVTLVVEIAGRTFKAVSEGLDHILESMNTFLNMVEDVFIQMGSTLVGLAKKILKAVSFFFEGSDVFAFNDIFQGSIKAMVRMATHAASTGAERVNWRYKQQIDKIDSQIGDLIDKSKSAQADFDKFEQAGVSIGGVKVNNPLQTAKEYRAAGDVMASARTHMNLAFSQVAENTTALSEEEHNALTELLDKFTKYYKDNIEPSATKLIDQFKKDGIPDTLKSNPFLILDLVRGIVKTIAKGVGDILEAAVKVVCELVEKLFSALNNVIESTFLTTLVRLWSGNNRRELTYFDLVTLPVAFFGTAFWKIIVAKAPYTEEDARRFVNWVGTDTKGPVDIWRVLSTENPPDNLNNLEELEKTAVPPPSIPDYIVAFLARLVGIVGLITATVAFFVRAGLTFASIKGWQTSPGSQIINLGAIFAATLIEGFRFIMLVKEVVKKAFYPGGKPIPTGELIWRSTFGAFGYIVGGIWAVATTLLVVFPVALYKELLVTGAIYFGYMIAGIFSMITDTAFSSGTISLPAIIGNGLSIIGSALAGVGCLGAAASIPWIPWEPVSGHIVAGVSSGATGVGETILWAGSGITSAFLVDWSNT